MRLEYRLQLLPQESISDALSASPPSEFLVLWLEVEVMHAAGKVLRSFEPALDKCFVDDRLGSDVRQFTSLPCLYLLSHRLEVRCIRSTPTEMQSMSENDFECLASTGVNTLGTVFPNWVSAAMRRS